MPKNSVVRIIAAAALLALGLLFLWLPPAVSTYSGFDALSGRAEEMVDSSTEQNLKAFLTLSVIKSGLAVIEDSAVGVGFHLEIGDVVQSVYDYVDFIWEMLLYSLVVLGSYKLLLETNLLELGLLVMGAGFVTWGVGLAAAHRSNRFRNLGQRVVLVGVLFAYIVPLSLLATNYATVHYTGPLKAKHGEQLTQVETQLSHLQMQMGALRDNVSLFQPLDSIDQLRRRIGAITESSVGTVRESTQAMLYYTVIVLFELFVFPLVSAFLLYRFLAAALGRVLVVPVEAQPHRAPEALGR